MSAYVSVAQAKAGFAALIARAEAGEKIVVTRNGRPVACLGPLTPYRPIRYGDLRGTPLADDLSLPEDVISDLRADLVTIAILVDTHIVLWARITPEKLSPEERGALDAAQLRFISAVTLWEIAILMTLGRVGSNERLLHLPDGFDLLPVRPEHCRTLLALPRLHGDPFDRMLIAQARSEELGLLTRDKAIMEYGPHGALIISRRD